jgi:hypothetical protein
MRPTLKPRPPSYGGSTIPGQIRMTDGSRWTVATRDPEQTILVRVIASPMRRLRLGAARIPLLRGVVLRSPSSASPERSASSPSHSPAIGACPPT